MDSPPLVIGSDSAVSAEDANPPAVPVHQRAALAETRWGRLLLQLFGIAVVLGVWEGTSRFGLVDSSELPPPSEVAQRFWELLGTSSFWEAVRFTLTSWAIGLLIGSAVGVALGVVIGGSESVWRALRPTLEFLRPLPGVALLPMALLTWGVTTSSDVFLVAFGTVWIMVMQTIYGMRDLDDVALQTAKSFRLTRRDRLRFVTIPSALPYIATGLRISSSAALIIAVTAELIIGTPGLGNAIGLAQAASVVGDMFALIFATGLLGVCINVLFTRFERHFLHWHRSQRIERGEA